MLNPVANACIIFAIILLNCKATNDKKEKDYPNNEKISGYNFTKPDRIIELPYELSEISGITPIDTNTLACIQDESGVLYLYNLSSNEIKNRFTFYDKGDFEDITRVDTSMYILRSNATLFEISNYVADPTKVNLYIMGIEALDNEGLCYDKDHDRLLVASKGNSGKGSGLKNIRDIYAFDLKTKTLVETPVFKFDERIIKQFALDHKIEVPVKQNKNGENEPDIKFRPTAICIHPITKKLFLLSGPDHGIFIFSTDGTLEYFEILNPDLFNQAEGLTFLENGDLLISNEAGEKKPTILRFNYNSK
ncbi:MAG: hypothetical protein ABI761_08080 [Saprospiraceae bacterium]